MSILAETAESVIPTGTWAIDAAHSTVEFHVTHAGIATVKGRAPVVQGTIFGAERHPELRFVSTGVESRGGELVVRGDLTIRGVTKPVELRGRFTGTTLDAYGNERIGLELAGIVDRTEFGVSWNAPLPGGGYLLPNEIPLYASFSAIRDA
jgi:polyisoprenoid-binding protein YceI